MDPNLLRLYKETGLDPPAGNSVAEKAKLMGDKLEAHYNFLDEVWSEERKDFLSDPANSDFKF